MSIKIYDDTINGGYASALERFQTYLLDVQDRRLETEHGKKLRLQAEALCLAGGGSDGLQQVVLRMDGMGCACGREKEALCCVSETV